MGGSSHGQEYMLHGERVGHVPRTYMYLGPLEGYPCYLSRWQPNEQSSTAMQVS